MSVRRMIAASALSLGLLAAAPGTAGAQSPPEVSPTSAQVGGTQLTRTGTDTMPIIVVGSGLAAAGAVLVVAARKRRGSLAPA